jgi:hypothetical protein
MPQLLKLNIVLSIPARHPTLGPAGRKLFAQMQESLTPLRKKEYPAKELPEED